MEFKKDLEIVVEEFYYDLFSGYIQPEDTLVNSEDILKVRNAMNIIKEYKKLLYATDNIHEM